MTKILTDNFNTYMAKMLKESFEPSANNHYYLFAARSLPWDNDSQPPAPQKSVTQTYYDVFDEMLFGKKITSDNIYQVIRNTQWSDGTTYDIYDPDDTDLANKNFFVVVNEGAELSVFKCLNNAGGVPSTDKPKKSETSADDEFYQTNDKYVWKYMYSIPQSIYADYATSEYIPIIPDANVTANAVSGSIDVFLVEDRGTNYNSYAKGTFKESAVAGNNLIMSLTSEDTLSGNTDFYKNNSIYIRAGRGAGQIRTITEYIVTGDERRVLVNKPYDTVPDTTSVFEIGPRVIIDGDGIGAEAVVTVNNSSNTISNIEVISRGEGYTYTDAIVVANSGFLDANSNVTNANNAKVKAIIGPQYGHGANVYSELFSSGVVISQKFIGTETGTISVDNDFRKFGILRNPLFSNTVLTVESSLGFADEQTVTQDGSVVAEVSAVNADGANTIRLRNIHGQFVTGGVLIASNSSANNIASTQITQVDRDINTFNQTQVLAIEMVYPGPQGTGFIEDERVVQDSTSSASYVNSANSSIISLSDVRGHISVSDDVSGDIQTITGELSGAVAKITGKKLGDVHDGKGEILYVENMEPVSRDAGQSERIKLIVDF